MSFSIIDLPMLTALSWNYCLVRFSKWSRAENSTNPENWFALYPSSMYRLPVQDARGDKAEGANSRIRWYRFLKNLRTGFFTGHCRGRFPCCCDRYRRHKAGVHSSKGLGRRGAVMATNLQKWGISGVACSRVGRARDTTRYRVEGGRWTPRAFAAMAVPR